jgi:hypothetical protein
MSMTVVYTLTRFSKGGVVTPSERFQQIGWACIFFFQKVAYTHARTNKQGNTDLGQLAQNQFVTHPDLSADYS